MRQTISKITRMDYAKSNAVSSVEADKSSIVTMVTQI